MKHMSWLSGFSATLRLSFFTASSQKSHQYEFHLSEDKIPENSNGEIIIQLRMLFRSFKPHLLTEHPLLLENLPVFEMATLKDTVYIK